MKKMKKLTESNIDVNLKKWWEYEPDQVMKFIYWTKRQVPPTDDRKWARAWLDIEKQLQKKYPITESTIDVNLKKWWEYEPDQVMKFVYWTKRQVPPTDDRKWARAWLDIEKQLQKKYPITETVGKKFSTKTNKTGRLVKNFPLREDNSKKNRFLGIFNPGKDIFQRRIKNLPPTLLKKLIIQTKSNGDTVEVIGLNAWGITKASGKNNQAVWQYSDGDLLFINPNYPSVYDTYIRKQLK